ncbi:hypothetical protein AQUCO_02400149v1 [Aquilegia coerulea]|uniref:AAA+ ATPase domain-containing protein n=1 Tax=Aquilegia coerulea TaxID=218851 RepID=A0A2G5DBL4_AQUCA|nr:hypothetical protein AQUCO_02400149v1 [Aquilegia coerulea]
MDVILDWKSIGSLLATFMFIRTAINDFLPPEIYQYLKRFFSKIFSSLLPKVTIIIEEFDGAYTNDIFEAVQAYLSSKCFSSAQVLKLSRPKNFKNLTFSMNTNQSFEETFEGIKIKWSFYSVEKKTSNLGYSRSLENRLFELSFHRKYKESVHSSYIPHVMEVAEAIKFRNRERKLYTNRAYNEDGRIWSSIPFSHPSTFDTLAIDPVLKEDIKQDLMRFVRRKEFYSRVGRAWKRGYLLYGPPGTGKTSLIAAIANFLEFDIYDMELTAVTSNSQMRKLLISTSNKSVIVVEDIDCSLDLSDRKKKESRAEDDNNENEGDSRKIKSQKKGSLLQTVSLSGVLNFVDGLWSSCGGERLIIFTTNHKEKLDAALLRPGRMDKHINLSFCEIEAFKMLAKNYLGIDKHELMRKVEKMLPLTKMTPADIAEIFMSCEEDADMGMISVIKRMVKEKKKNDHLTIEDASVDDQKSKAKKNDDNDNEDASVDQKSKEKKITDNDNEEKEDATEKKEED